MLVHTAQQDTAEQIRSFVVANFYVADPAALGDEVSLLDSGIVDSTGVLELVAFIEDRFGIKVRDEELLPENLDGIGKLTRFIERRQSPSEAASDVSSRPG